MISVDPLSALSAADFSITDFKSALGEHLGASFYDDLVRTPIGSAFRFREQALEESRAGRILGFNTTSEEFRQGAEAFGLGRLDEGVNPPTRMLTKDEANEKGKDLGLTFDRETPEGVVDLLIQRKTRERARQTIFQRGRVGGFGTGRALLSGLAGFLANAIDPINVASAFVPISRIPLAARGLSAIENVAARRAATGVIEGAGGQLLVEPIVLGQAINEQADYTFYDSLAAVAFGAVLGGGLHLGIGAVLDRRARARARGVLEADTPLRDTVNVSRETIPTPEARSTALGRTAPAVETARQAVPSPEPGPLAREIDAMPVEVREAAGRAATTQLLTDRKLDVEPIVDLGRAETGKLPISQTARRAIPAKLADAEVAGVTVRTVSETKTQTPGGPPTVAREYEFVSPTGQKETVAVSGLEGTPEVTLREQAFAEARDRFETRRANVLRQAGIEEGEALASRQDAPEADRFADVAEADRATQTVAERKDVSAEQEFADVQTATRRIEAKEELAQVDKDATDTLKAAEALAACRTLGLTDG